MALTTTSPLSIHAFTNDQVCRILGNRAAQDLFGEIVDSSHAEVGSLSINHFSFTFSVKVMTLNGARDVYVKIPKSDMRGLVSNILPITSEDRRMAQEEVASLRLLGRSWNGDDLDVRWVTLRGVIPEYNAIVTDRIFADEALEVFRRFDLRRRFFGFQQDAQRLRSSMARLGAALGRFHQTNARVTVFRLCEALPKLEFYCRELASVSGSAWPDRISRKLRSMGDVVLSGIAVPTLKGIDIRNVLIDAKDRLYLLDPGRTKFTHREADLARFVMTYRLLYWGSKLLPLVGDPDPSGESAFLDAYYSSTTPQSPQLLNFFLLKELLKHWHTGLDSLQRLSWPSTLKRLVASNYVDPFYARQFARQLQLLMK